MKNEHRNPPDYQDGRNARVAGLPKIAPANITPVLRYWWLAGYGDMDHELKQTDTDNRRR
jgi:hypothetical protein